MKLIFSKRFQKRLVKLPKTLQNKTVEVIKRFQNNPLEPALKNHALKGSLMGKRAISVTGDLRVIFEEYDDYVMVVMLDVGGHSEVY